MAAEIRFYRDADGDGRAERREVVLTGFGTQDSHLFAHQFLRQPGGWMFVAQGLFNYSTVRRPDGTAVHRRRDRGGVQPVQARAIPAGWLAVLKASPPVPTTSGGWVTSREGETFMQEANDLGYPVIPYEPGIYVSTGSRDRLRPYQPLMPPPARARADGRHGLERTRARGGSGMVFFERWKSGPQRTTRIFYLANPITGVINLVKAVSDGPRYRFEKLAGLCDVRRPLVPADRRSTSGPTAASTSSIGTNKIISHNEVPREHPDRDKTRDGSGACALVNSRASRRPTSRDSMIRALLAQLGAPETHSWPRLAWLEIGDRRATALVPDLGETGG